MQTAGKQRARLVSPEYWFHDLIRVTGGPPGLLWFRPKKLYADDAAREKIRGGALIISNHATNFDPLYLMLTVWYRRHHFVCLRSFFNGRFQSWLFRHFLCIPIDRENASLETIRTITDHLRRGELVSMFPEGHITRENEAASLRGGMVLIASQAGTPIIPVHICKRAHWYSRLRVVIGAPVSPASPDGGRPGMQQLEQLVGRLENEMKRLASLAGENR